MNTYHGNPRRGLSWIQKEILAWLEATPNGEDWMINRPRKIRFAIHESSISRAFRSLERRHLIELGGKGGSWSSRRVKLLIRPINHFEKGDPA